MKIKRRRVESATEKNLAIGTITSTQFLRSIVPSYRPEYVQNDYIKTVCKWSIDYYHNFGEAPGKQIQDIFEFNQEEIEIEQSKIIAQLLENLSNQFEGEGFNAEYAIDKTLDYFKKRELTLTSARVQELIEAGRVNEAERALADYKAVARVTSGWADPFDPTEIEKVFYRNEGGSYKLPGAVGDMLGPIEPGWLVGILGAYKRGKTWWLQEMAVQAVLKGLKTVFISLEMRNISVQDRLYKRLTSYWDETNEEHLVYPVFDCQLNQTGECNKSEREGNVVLYDPEEETKPNFDDFLKGGYSKYTPCTACRNRSPHKFVPDYWFMRAERPLFRRTSVERHLQSFKRMYGDKLRIISYPKFSATLADIKRDLEYLEMFHEFVPQVVVIDYADAMAEDSRNRVGEKGYESIDRHWMSLAGFADMGSIRLITASQASPSDIEKAKLGPSSVGGFKGKLAHVDAMMTLNQVPQEKRDKIMRVGLVAHRYIGFSDFIECLVLQNYGMGQVFLDSELLIGRGD